MVCSLVLDYQFFLDSASLLFSKFPFSILIWIKDLFASLIGVQPLLPNVSLHVFVFDINPLSFLVDYSAILDPLMLFFRWLLTAILILNFVRSYLDRIL